MRPPNGSAASSLPDSPKPNGLTLSLDLTADQLDAIAQRVAALIADTTSPAEDGYLGRCRRR